MNIVKDLSECEKLWKQFSLHETIWDDWDVALSFFDKTRHEPYFLVADYGLLPLWKDKTNNRFYFFGGEYPENRKFWFPIEKFKEVFSHLPNNTKIFDIQGEMVDSFLKEWPEFEKFFTEEDYHYFLNLNNFNYELEAYLKTFNKKHRKNFLYDMKKLKDSNLELVWEKLEHFQDCVDFNVKRFGSESDFSDSVFVQDMKRFLDLLNKRNEIFTLTIIKNGKVEGIEIATFHKNKYYVLNGGYNRDIKNLGKLIMFEHIKKALEFKAEIIDFLVGDTGWKQLWNFEKERCRTFFKP